MAVKNEGTMKAKMLDVASKNYEASAKFRLL